MREILWRHYFDGILVWIDVASAKRGNFQRQKTKHFTDCEDAPATAGQQFVF